MYLNVRICMLFGNSGKIFWAESNNYRSFCDIFDHVFRVGNENVDIGKSVENLQFVIFNRSILRFSTMAKN